MDKYEYREKTEKMLEYAEKKQYKEAMDIADQIEWKRVKSVLMLSSVSEIYERNGEYAKSRLVLRYAYDRQPGSRKLAYRLGTLALKDNDIQKASDYYEEFVKIAPKDPNQYILKYKILKAQDGDVQEQIAALKEFKEAEYVEKWAYELATVYQKAGMISECIEECDDLMLWFSDGKYVYRAMELKMQYKSLTPVQQMKYDARPGAEVKKLDAGQAAEKISEEEAAVIAEKKAEALVAEVMEDAVVEETVKSEEEAVEEAAKSEGEVEEVVKSEGEETEEETLTADEKAEEETEEETLTADEKAEEELADAIVSLLADEIEDASEDESKKAEEAIRRAEEEAAKKAEEEAAKKAEEEAKAKILDEKTRRIPDDIVRLMSELEDDMKMDAAEEGFKNTKPEAAKLEVAELEETDFEETDFEEADFEEADFEEAELKEEDFEEGDLEEAELLSEDDVVEAELLALRCDLEDTNKNEGTLTDLELVFESTADFSDLDSLVIEEPADLVIAVDEEKDAKEETVASENMVEENIVSEDNAEETMEEADFEEDDFEEADFEEADFEEAELKEEDFEKAEVDEEEFEEEDLSVLDEMDQIDKALEALGADEHTEAEMHRRKTGSTGKVPFDTGFVVTGRYDLSATSEIGLKAGLNEEQKKLFSYFVPVRGMSEQIVDVLDNDKIVRREGTSKIGNLMVIGGKGSGKTALAVDIVKAIQKQRNLQQGKMALIDGETLSKKDMAVIFAKLHGGALIIENAGTLTKKCVIDMNLLMERQTGELLIVLEDQKEPMSRLMAVNPEFRKKFTSKLELPVFVNDELVTFGQTYAKENGCKLDEMGILALYSKIDILQREDHAVTVAEVKDIMDEAIEHSKRANVKHLARRMFGKRKDDKNRIILSEEDFQI